MSIYYRNKTEGPNRATLDDRLYVPTAYPSELTPAGEQTVIPGCERQPAAGKPAQLNLFER
jgi:hypothetical protein